MRPSVPASATSAAAARRRYASTPHGRGPTVIGFAGVLALVLAETVAGALAFTWIGPLWNETKRSYFTLHTVILTVLFAAPCWWAAASGWTTSQGQLSARAAGVTFALCAVSSTAFLIRRPPAG